MDACNEENLAASDRRDHVVGRGHHVDRLRHHLVWPGPFMDSAAPDLGGSASGRGNLFLRLFKTGFKKCPAHYRHPQGTSLPIRLPEMDKLPPGPGDGWHGDLPAPLLPHSQALSGDPISWTGCQPVCFQPQVLLPGNTHYPNINKVHSGLERGPMQKDL